MVKLSVLFKDASGAVIHEEDFHPVLTSSLSHGNNKPLKGGFVWQMESGRFYAAKSVPSEWKEGSVEARISDIRLLPAKAATNAKRIEDVSARTAGDKAQENTESNAKTVYIQEHVSL